MKIKYFSQLTPKQKDNANRFFLRAKYNVLDLPESLAKSILSNIEIDKIFKIYDLLRGQKLVYVEKLKCYIPINIKKLITQEV